MGFYWEEFVYKELGIGVLWYGEFNDVYGYVGDGYLGNVGNFGRMFWIESDVEICIYDKVVGGYVSVVSN